ncbi:unnamed protein product, partial [Ectocarpus fasciculatus]
WQRRHFRYRRRRHRRTWGGRRSRPRHLKYGAKASGREGIRLRRSVAARIGFTTRRTHVATPQTFGIEQARTRSLALDPFPRTCMLEKHVSLCDRHERSGGMMKPDKTRRHERGGRRAHSQL